MQDRLPELLTRLEQCLQEQEQALGAGDAVALQRSVAAGLACLAGLASMPQDELRQQPELGRRLRAALERSAEIQSKAARSLAELGQALGEVARQRQAATAFSAAQRWPGQGGAYLNEKR
ncbi:MAG: hypothetical protein ACYC5Y_00605 [Symbiobacteriia bacterium]